MPNSPIVNNRFYGDLLMELFLPQTFGEDGITFVHLVETDSVIAFAGQEKHLSISIKEWE